jgi:hypothetical protein
VLFQESEVFLCNKRTITVIEIPWSDVLKTDDPDAVVDVM